MAVKLFQTGEDIKVIDLIASTVSDLTKSRINDQYTYMDTNDLQEHLYSIDDLLEEIEEAEEEGIIKDELEEIDELLKQHKAAYFRLIKP